MCAQSHSDTKDQVHSAVDFITLTNLLLLIYENIRKGRLNIFK